MDADSNDPPPCSLLDLGRDVLLAQGLSNTALPDPDGTAAPETDASTAAAVVPRIECLPGKLPDFAPFAAVTALGANFLADGPGPATVDLCSLRCLAAVEPGFCRGSGVASVRLPGSVTAIGAGFCAGTGRLGRLDLRGDCPLLESIDDTFCSCSALTALTLPPALRHVGDSFCSSLQCVDFPPPAFSPALAAIGSNFFSGTAFGPDSTLDLSMTRLVDLPDCFLKRASVSSVLLPSTVVRIGSGCMAHMTGLSGIEQLSVPLKAVLAQRDWTVIDVVLSAVRHVQDDFLRGADRPVRLRASSALQSVGDAFCAFPLESEADGGGGSGGGGGYGALSLPGSASVGANFAHSARLRQSRIFRPVARAFFASQHGSLGGREASRHPITLGDDFMSKVRGVADLDLTQSLASHVGARFASESSMTALWLPESVTRIDVGFCAGCPASSVWIPPCAIDASMTTAWEDLDRAGVHKQQASIVADLCAVLLPQCRRDVAQFLLAHAELELFHKFFDVKNAHEARLLRAVGGAALLPAVPRSVPRWPGLSTAALQGPDTGMSLLHWALRHRRQTPLLFEAVSWQLSDLGRVTARGLQPLHVAVAFDVDTHTVKRLLGTASTAEVQGAWSAHDTAALSTTPLHFAFLHRRPGLVEAFLDGGFDPTERTRILQPGTQGLAEFQLDAYDQALVELGRVRRCEDIENDEADDADSSDGDDGQREEAGHEEMQGHGWGTRSRLSPGSGGDLPLVLLDACLLCIALDAVAAFSLPLTDPAVSSFLRHHLRRLINDIGRFGQRRFDRTEARFRQRQLAARLGHVLAGCDATIEDGLGFDDQSSDTESDAGEGKDAGRMRTAGLGGPGRLFGDAENSLLMPRLSSGGVVPPGAFFNAPDDVASDGGCACRCAEWQRCLGVDDTAHHLVREGRRRIEEEYRVADLTAVDLASAGLLLALCDPTFADAAARRRDLITGDDAALCAFVSHAVTDASLFGGPESATADAEPAESASSHRTVQQRRALFGRVADLCDKASRMADLPRASEAASDVATYRGLVDKMEAGPYRKAVRAKLEGVVPYSTVCPLLPFIVLAILVVFGASWIFHPPILEPVVTDIEVSISTCVNPYTTGGPDMLPWNCSVPFTEVGLLQSAPMGAASSGAFVYEYDFITRQGLAGLDRTPVPWSHMRFASTVQYGGRHDVSRPSGNDSTIALCTPAASTGGECLSTAPLDDYAPKHWLMSELRRPASWPTEYDLEFNPKPNRSTALFFDKKDRAFEHVVIPHDFGPASGLIAWFTLMCATMLVCCGVTALELWRTVMAARRFHAPLRYVRLAWRLLRPCRAPDPNTHETIGTATSHDPHVVDASSGVTLPTFQAATAAPDDTSPKKHHAEPAVHTNADDNSTDEMCGKVPLLVPVSLTAFAWRVAAVAIKIATLLLTGYCLNIFRGAVVAHRGGGSPPPWSVVDDWQKMELLLRIVSLLTTPYVVAFFSVLPRQSHFVFMNSYMAAVSLLLLLVVFFMLSVVQVSLLQSSLSLVSDRTVDLVTLPVTIAITVWLRRNAAVKDSVRQQHYEHLERLLAEERARRLQERSQRATQRPTASPDFLATNPPPQLNGGGRMSWPRRSHNSTDKKGQEKTFVSMLTVTNVERAQRFGMACVSFLIIAAIYALTVLLFLSPLLIAAPPGTSVFTQSSGLVANARSLARIVPGL